jgi:hypothetical protein
MSPDLVSFAKYRVTKDLEPFIGQMNEAELANILALSFRRWIEGMDPLQRRPTDIRLTLMRVTRAAFFSGVGDTAYLADTNRRFGGNASWQRVCQELDKLIPEAESLALDPRQMDDEMTGGLHLNEDTKAVSRATKLEHLPEYLSPQEFAAFLGIGRTSVYELIRRGGGAGEAFRAIDPHSPRGGHA